MLGAGGFGRVWDVASLETAMAAEASKLVFKEYTDAARPVLDGRALRASVLFGERLRATGVDLSRFAAWPSAVVMERGDIVGVLMHRAPSEFWLDLKPDEATNTPSLAHCDFLLNSSRYQASQMGFVPSVDSRLLLLSDVAGHLATLHRLGVVIGDLSPRNLLFAFRPSGARSYLLDCDGVEVDGRTAFGRPETPAWSIAALTGRQEPWSAASDVYKFALLVTRMLSGDQLVRDTRYVTGLPRALREVLDQSLDPDPAQRPSAASWVEPLHDAVERVPRPFDAWSGTGASARGRHAPTPFLRFPESREHRGILGSRLRILMLGTEWLPKHGGLSQFNRHLAIALAWRGHEVASTVLTRAAPDDIDAAEHGVRLVVPEVVRGYPDLHIRPPTMAPADIDVVIGHDRFTGLAAVTQARVNFPGAALAQVVHAFPEELEWLKGRDGATGRAEARIGELRATCAEADVVCAVGPRLSRLVGTMLHDGFAAPLVVRLDPGLEFSSTGRPAGRSPGPEAVCLLLGRTEDPDLKGLDLGARAFAGLPAGIRALAKLAVRGAPESTGDALHRSLTTEYGLNRGEVVVRPFDPTPGTVDRDLRSASVLMMPSRGEGFGLVGLEAISVGTPVLVSSRSGLAEMLLDHAPTAAVPFVVRVDDASEADAARWGQALSRVLADRERALSLTLDLWDELERCVSWDAVAESVEVAVWSYRQPPEST